MDLSHQLAVVDAEKRRKHEEWIMMQQNQCRFDHKSSGIRAIILVSEAHRLEKEHLRHQHICCKRLLQKCNKGLSTTPSPARRLRCESVNVFDCPCVRAPVFRQLAPKYRAMNLLQPHFADCDLESTVDTIQQTYRNDTEMLEDLLDRYGPERAEVDPVIWLRSIEYRQDTLEGKWKDIQQSVRQEMMHRDNFQVVIRNLSIMRIFLEGSQAATYSCDMNERARRDAFHRGVLEQLDVRGTLFI